MAKKTEHRYLDAGKLEEASRLESQARAFEAIIEKELQILGLQPGSNVLDAGCGTGAVARRIASKISPGRVHGVDMDPLFVSEAKRLALKEGIDNVSYQIGDVNKMIFGDGAFDVSYCRLVLMHVKDPVRVVTEMKRVTKRNGLVAASDNDDRLIATYPNIPKLLKLWSKYGEWARSKMVDRYIGRKLFSIFSQAGLDAIDVFPFPVHATQRNPEALKMLVSVPVEILQMSKEAMISDGFITAQEYEKGIEELPLLLNDPGAFAMGTSFFAVGKLP